MLKKIMYKGDMFFPDLNGKNLKGIDRVDAIGISTIYGNIPTLDYSLRTTTMPAGSYHLYLFPDNYRDNIYGFRMFDLMSYIQNGGVLSRLLNHLYHWLGGVCYG